jgi:magnesium transporter
MLDILRRLGSSDRTMLLSRFPEPVQSTFYSLLDWPTESVGANMRHEFLAIGDQDTVGSAKQLIHDAWDNAQLFQHLYVVNTEHRLLGSIALKTLLIADPLLPVSELMDRDTVRINARADQELAARLLIDRDISTLPVEEQGKLVGIFHVDDAADILELESTEDAEMQGGSSPLDTPYLQATPWQLWRKRVGWLLILFVAEAYTGTVLRAFEEQLEAAIALAFFIPLLIGTGGNSGTQITTTIVRAMAVGEVSLRNLGTVLKKELSTGLLISESGRRPRDWHGGDLYHHRHRAVERHSRIHYPHGAAPLWHRPCCGVRPLHRHPGGWYRSHHLLRDGQVVAARVAVTRT